jgi:mannose-6-phosphate isomerase-like protein (cupin superfamily)
MDRCVKLRDIQGSQSGSGITTFRLLGEGNGCSRGCTAGVSVFTSPEYNKAGTHDNQEGFYVLEGTGWARIGSEEYPIEPATALFVPALTEHAFRVESGPLKLFWFHAAT